jgi:transposase
MEATGHYWLSLYSRLKDQGHDIIALNPLQTSAYRKRQIRPVKNDKVDAICIAEVLRQEPFIQTKMADEMVLGLRTLSRFRVELVDQCSDQKRRTLAVLDQIFPEFETLFSNVFGKTASALLETYPTPATIAQLDLDSLAAFLSQHSRKRLGRAKAEQIQEAARHSFGVTLALEALTTQLRLLLTQLRFLSQQIADLEGQIHRLLQQIPQQLTTIPGIGSVLAAAILGEVGDIKRFKNAAALVAYAGLDPSVHQSGQFQATRMRISKRGSPYLRRALWQAASGARQYDPALRQRYTKQIQAGKHAAVAVGAVANKLLHIIYAILRDNKPYVCVAAQA